MELSESDCILSSKTAKTFQKQPTFKKKPPSFKQKIIQIWLQIVITGYFCSRFISSQIWYFFIGRKMPFWSPCYRLWCDISEMGQFYWITFPWSGFIAVFDTLSESNKKSLLFPGLRPYKCDLCDKSFARLQTLQEHTNRHLGLKPYTCRECNKSM